MACTTDSCGSVKIEYKGNGNQTNFTFPFTYVKQSDVYVELFNETTGLWEETTDWTFENATTIKFNTAPPAPTTSVQETIRIYRCTDISPLIATFNPGSAIRARDLNDNFEQLQSSLQEAQCAAEGNLGNKSNVVTKFMQENGQWVEFNDNKLASTDAIVARHDAYIQDDKPEELNHQQPGKNWQNTDECYTTYWNDDANAWVAYVNTGPRGIPGQDGAAADVSVGETFTGDAGTDASVIDTGTDGAVVLNFTIPKGDKGDRGDGLNVTGYIDYPGPPIFQGTEQGDYVLDSEGHGWFWETDVDPATWIDTGTIRGPKGDKGDAGNDGDDGDAATITVDNTVTGPAGSEATVVNTGTSNAAVLVFTIPRGEKGDKGDDGTGAGTLTGITTTLPITVDMATNPAVPALGLDIDSLTNILDL